MLRRTTTCLLFLLFAGWLVGPAMADSAADSHVPSRLEAQIVAAKAGLDVSGAWLTTLSHGAVVALDDQGLRLAGQDDGTDWQLGLRLTSFGRHGAMHQASVGTLRAGGVRAELDHGRLRQWITGSGPRLTHGFTFDQPPYVQDGGRVEAGSGDLLLHLALGNTGFQTALSPGGAALELERRGRLLSYGTFTATDARGQRFPTRLELTPDGGRVTLRVDDAGAIYPLTLFGLVVEGKKLVNPLAMGVEHAGWSVALDGDTAAVGAFLADVGFAGAAGKVYIFERNEGGAENWGLLQTLTAADAEPGGSFGYSVSISGDTLVVGAHQKDDDLLLPGDRVFADSGRAYVFQRSGGTWSQIRELENPTPFGFDNFGFSVSISGDTLAVGAWLAEPAVAPLTLENGEVSLYQRDLGGPSQWGIVTTITTPTPMGWANFGHDVALDGDTLVVGSPFTDPVFTGTGLAWVHERNQGGANAWGAVTPLEADDGELFDRFGDSVAIDGDVIVVGADFANGTGVDSGKAYVFERDEGGTNAWGQTARLTASDQESGDFFGWAVAVEGDQVVVGSHFDDSPLFNAGSAYLFERQAGGWTQVEKFLPAGVDVGDDFGIAVDLSGGTILAGARLTGPADSGVAYIFELAASTDLSISVSSTPNPVAPGGTVTYTVTVENLGSSDATDVAVSHFFAPDSGAGSTTSGCLEDPAGTSTCSLGTVAAGMSVQYTLTRPVDMGASGTLSFTATLGATTDDPDAGNNEITDVVVVGGGGGGSADLLLLKQDSEDPAAPGGTLVYTLEVLNNGPDEAVNVVVTEALPPGVSVAVTSGCAEDPVGIPSCSLGNVLPGTSKMYTVTVTVDASAGETLLNTATVSADTDDPNIANNQANESTDVGVGNADLLIFIDDDVDPITAGDVLTYTVDVLNNGPDAAPGVVVETLLPPSVTSPMTTGCTEDPAGAASCSLGEIAAGSSASFTITVQTDAMDLGPLVATASVTSDATDNLPANNTSTEATTVDVVGDVDLFLFVTDSMDPIDAGLPLTYTFYVGNRGPGTAQGVELTLPVSNDFLNASTTGCAEGAGGTPTCTLAAIEPGSTQVVTLTGELLGTFSGTFELAASVASANNELVPADNQILETTTVIGTPGMADLVISIEEAADPVAAGDAVVYIVTVLNLGPNLAEGVTLSAATSPLFTAVTSSGCQEDPAGWPSCSLGSLEPGLPISATFEATLDLGASGTLEQSIAVQSTTEDPDLSNNEDSESTTVESIGLANLQVSFSQADATAAPGGMAAYTVLVENLGPDAAEGVEVMTTLTGQVGAATTTGCAEDPSGVPACSLGTVNALAAFASTTFTIEVPVLADASGTVEVAVAVSSALDDTDMANNSASATTDIDASPPTVTLLNSMGDTGDGLLEACEEARVDITQLLVTFSESMNDPAGDTEVSDVTNPAVYQLVSAGADRDLATEQCGAVQTDDQVVTIHSVGYDAASMTATLELGGVLPDAPYRLLVCETVTDAAGNALDGDDDGSAGSDFGRYFRVDTDNLFADGHYDCSLDAWEETATADTEITYTAFDVDSASISGAAIFYNNLSTTDYSIGQCVAARNSGNYRMSGMVWLRDLEAELTISLTCEFFTDDNCVGGAASLETVSQSFSAPTAGWTALDSATLLAPAGTMSALCSFDLQLADDNAEMTVLVDDLRLSGRAFEDGFETGDTSSWSTTVGN